MVLKYNIVILFDLNLKFNIQRFSRNELYKLYKYNCKNFAVYDVE